VARLGQAGARIVLGETATAGDLAAIVQAARKLETAGLADKVKSSHVGAARGGVKRKLPFEVEALAQAAAAAIAAATEVHRPTSSQQAASKQPAATASDLEEEGHKLITLAEAARAADKALHVAYTKARLPQ
jgi:hypothetical protein